MSTTDETKAEEFADTSIDFLDSHGELDGMSLDLRGMIRAGLMHGYKSGMKRGRAMGTANAVRQFEEKLPALLREQQARAWDEGWDAGLTHVTPAVNPYRDE